MCRGATGGRQGRPQRHPQLTRSALDFGSMAILITGSGNSMRSSTMGSVPQHRVSPVGQAGVGASSEALPMGGLTPRAPRSVPAVLEAHMAALDTEAGSAWCTRRCSSPARVQHPHRCSCTLMHEHTCTRMYMHTRAYTQHTLTPTCMHTHACAHLWSHP